MTNKKNIVIIYSALLFALCALIVLFLYPKEKKFLYEYTVGLPWAYDNLVADTDISIYKTEQEINIEKDSIVSQHIPYFVYDDLVYKTYQQKLSLAINNMFEYRNVFNNNTSNISHLKNTNTQFNNSLDSLLKSYYTIGIIELPSNYNKLSKDNKIMLFSNGISELSFATDYFTSKELEIDIVNLFVHSYIDIIDSLNSRPWMLQLLNSNHPPANIYYDNKLNNEIITNLSNNLSHIASIVKKSETIVKKSEIVTPYIDKILQSLKRQFESEHIQANNPLVVLGASMLFATIFSIIFFYFYFYQKQVFTNYRDITFFTLNIIVLVLTCYFILNKTDFNINVIPFTLFPLLILTFYNFQLAFLVFAFSILVSSFFAPNNFEFIIIQILTGVIALYTLKNKSRRRQIFICMLVVFFSYMILGTGFYLIKEGAFTESYFKILIFYGISSFLLLLYLPFIYITEKVFGFVSNYTLMELCDTNTKLLRMLSENAPGSFQHSVQVANLSEAVVRQLGGDALLVRAGAMYHDIGKLNNPESFIENQHGVNVHDTLDFDESSLKIISHVSYGVSIARKHKLPQQIIDFIETHHGTNITRYFYNSWVNANKNEKPNMANFQYPGPKPHSLETAILMMADSVEAASRTLSEYTEISIKQCINRIIDKQLEDGQFDNTDITLKQINIAKEIFAEKILTIYHARIIYPEITK